MMTPDEALAYFLVAPRTRSADLRADVIAALREAGKRRAEGPVATATVIRLAHDRLKMSYQDIEDLSFDAEAGTCIDDSTAQRLAIKYAR